jgi:hypothetical protein
VKLFGGIYSIAAFLILLAVSSYLSGKPYYNWDIFPYMAVAIDRPDVPFDSTIYRVYREAEIRMPARDFAVLSVKHPELRNDPREFKHILKYYTIKPGYLLTVRLFRFLGFDLVKATYLPSVVSYFLIGVLLLWWTPRLLAPPRGQIMALVACAVPFMVDTARYSSPDMLCAFIFLAGVCLVAESSVPVGLLVCAVSIVVRPDMIILYLFLIQALYLSKKTSVGIATVFSTIGAMIAYLIVGFPGILGEFLFTHPSYSPAWEAAELMPHYLSGLIGGFGTVLHSQAALFLVLGAAVLWLRRGQKSDFWSLMVIACWLTFLVRYLLHPLVEDRFLVSAYIIVIIAICQSIGSRRASLKRT